MAGFSTKQKRKAKSESDSRNQGAVPRQAIGAGQSIGARGRESEVEEDEQVPGRPFRQRQQQQVGRIPEVVLGASLVGNAGVLARVPAGKLPRFLQVLPGQTRMGSEVVPEVLAGKMASRGEKGNREQGQGQGQRESRLLSGTEIHGPSVQRSLLRRADRSRIPP